MSQKVTPKQLKALHMLMRGISATEVAQKLKLRRETISRWKNLPEFSQKFESLIEESQREMRHRMLSLIDTSITTLLADVKSIYGEHNRTQTALNVIKMVGFDVKEVANLSKPDKN